jgi:hypothetical protein
LADVKEEKEAGDDDAAVKSSSAGPPGSVRVPLIIMAVLVAVFAIAGIAAKKSKPKPYKTEGSRAVVLPAGDRQRVVVVPPCSPRAVVNEQNATSLISVPGVVAVALPQGAPARTVVIPRCSSAAAPMPGASNIPSSAFVLGPGETVSDVEKVPKGGDPVAFGIKHQVQIPTGSSITTVVVPPCQTKTPAEKVSVLSPRGAGGKVAIAPDC